MTIRVASYNTRDFLDDRRAAAAVVRAVAPDVLLLQEVPRRWWPAPRVRRFATEAGLRWPGGHRGSGGTTVMVSERITVEAVSHHGLPVPAGQRTRGYAVLRGRLADGPPVTAVSVHLGLFAGQRLRHTHQILAALPAAGSVVLAGDLNEGAGSPSWETIASRLQLLSDPAPTYPSWAPQERLDVVWGRGVRRVPGPPPALEPGAQILRQASDHLPVWVDVEVDAP
ncbi:endonuclease/exonuclease/phosphatase family protein [Arsenicicoccus sp. oral taxon 190]|uniref:endonuclease/exonuclease/phosphatase family protein n=1 Tax=Arsenicicoccus sp. oral taxon 190 TaxID=1658671 RepID=UPI00067A3FEA|nr:endonuclease/exonuclease/phosphatase family protein [Arsenicicoccus sp. oral taxon 190]AKT52044.1 hypothetical protein ADJ73_13550 [Arsenicicoccus sp. oral taxon 190]